VSGETSGPGLDTLREFSSGQKLFGRYTLIKTLGRGGMGVVWLARDEVLEREVALKFLPDLVVHDRAVLSDLKRETRRSLELTHKNIVRIHDFVHDENTGCISMEYVDGDTLSNLRADKPRKIFEVVELADWTSELCDALNYAHNHARIIHRDLKPANLMVNQRGELKITDFGIARSLSDSVSKVTVHGKSGTLVYMSPQQLDGERGSHLDDIYSFGASVYELLTGRPPFSSGNVDRQIREKIPPSMAQRRKELEIAGDQIDDSWERVVASCLAKDPARRPQSIAHIAEHLDLATPKTKTHKVPPLRKPRRQNYLLVFGILIVLALAAAGAWYFVFHKSSPTPAAMTVVAQQPPATAAPVATAAPAPAPVFGGLIVTTSPEGATVTLGGTSAGKSPVTFKDVRPGKYPLRITLSGYDRIDREVEIKANEFVDLGTLSLQTTKSAIELDSTPPGAKVFQTGTLLGTTPFRRADFSTGETDLLLVLEGYLPSEVKASLSPKEAFKLNVVLTKPAASYKGIISVPADPSAHYNVPLTIRLNGDAKSGTMTQTGKHGDTVVKFNGVWEGAVLHAVTDEVVSVPAGTGWSPESFNLRFTSDGQGASYECNAGGKVYAAKLVSQTVTSTAPIKYKGTIRVTGDNTSAGTPLTIVLEADRKSGTMTQSSKSGDTVVKFNGVLDGSVLHAVTDEVVSKPPKVQWSPESFTIRFNSDGTAGTYECKTGGKTYVATLTP
jgi:protein kinase-like protein/PEGA domain-containing protein